MKLSRPVVAAVWTIGVPLAHAVLPWGLSHAGGRHGWSDGAPGLVNLVGLLPIAVAVVGLAWVVALHVRHAPAQTELAWKVTYLVERGPYAVSRNPMYVAELALWLGWTALFGSVAVAIGFVVLWLGIACVVPAEERMLETQLGERYVAYRARVARWIG